MESPKASGGSDIEAFAQNEILVKNLPLIYYPYHLIGFDSNVSPTIPVKYSASIHCPQTVGECFINFSGLIITSHYNLEAGIPLLIISLAYPFYALKYRSNDFFEKKGSKLAISEYELVKKILYIEIPLFIFLTSIVFAGSFVGLLPNIASANNSIDQLTFYIVKSLQVALQYSVTAGALWMLFHTIRKEFRYYLARAYITNMPDRADNVERLQRLSITLNSYNKYLLRSLKLQIDTSKVYPRLVIESNVKVNECTKSMSESFDDNDKLTPARQLSQIMNLPNEELFLKRSLGAIIIMWGNFAFATILPVAISIIQWLYQFPKH